MDKAALEEMWKWIDRDLDDEFFDTKITDEREGQERWNEIPEILKPLAHTIITLACRNDEMLGDGGPCLLFRCQLFSVAKELEKKGVDIHLPYRWFCDGVMIEPEWIVRITNGLVKWNCKPDYDNPDECGLDECRFRSVHPPTDEPEKEVE